MLDKLMQIVQQSAQKSVVENNDVPNEHNEAVINEAGNSIFSGLQDMLAKGGVDKITDLFKNENGQDAANHFSGSFVENITQKFGIDKNAASGIAGSLIPQVLNTLKNKANTSADGGFDVSSILASLQGGNLGSTISNIGGKLGLDKDGDGDVDLNDITKMFGK
jgi:hypothetical protein